MQYGFVYIWFDRKHTRFYIGCHWGDENDGYVCSSPWMRQAYKHRPQDFKRRTLARIYTNRKDMLEEEYRWLSMINKDELGGGRYYNLQNHHFGHWSVDDERNLSTKQKLSQKAKENHSDPIWRAKYEEGLRSRDNRSSDPTVREKRRRSMLGKNVGRKKTEAFYEAMKKKRGKPSSEKQKARTKEVGNFKRLNSTRVACVHCCKEGNVGNIARYHNDKCKHKRQQA